VQVRVVEQVLPPSVQQGDHADFGTKVAWIGSNDTRGVGGCLEQDIINDRFVL